MARIITNKLSRNLLNSIDKEKKRSKIGFNKKRRKGAAKMMKKFFFYFYYFIKGCPLSVNADG